MDSGRQHSVSGTYNLSFSGKLKKLALSHTWFQGKGGQFKEWLRGAKYSNLSNTSGSNSAKLILLEDLPGY